MKLATAPRKRKEQDQIYYFAQWAKEVHKTSVL